MTKTIKKLNHAQLTETINRIIAEEMNALFKRVQDPGEFTSWIMRQWFSDQHKRAIWFDPKVTEDNVLDYVSSSKNHFPLTPKELTMMWKDMKFLRSKFGMSDYDEGEEGNDSPEETVPSASSAKKERSKGEVPHEEIGPEFGVSGTMIGYIEQEAQQKWHKLFGGKLPDDMEPEELRAVWDRIAEAEESASKMFTDRLVAAENVREFLTKLSRDGYISPGELPDIHRAEAEALEDLATRDPDLIRQMLLVDYQEDDNLFRSFQSTVSRTLHGVKKRGRPKKQNT